MAGGNKKKKKPAANPARGVATTSIQSKTKTESAKDTDGTDVSEMSPRARLGRPLSLKLMEPTRGKAHDSAKYTSSAQKNWRRNWRPQNCSRSSTSMQPKFEERSRDRLHACRLIVA